MTHRCFAQWLLAALGIHASHIIERAFLADGRRRAARARSGA